MKNYRALTLGTAAVYKGMYLKKEIPADIKSAKEAYDLLHKELGDITTLLDTTKKAMETQYTDLNTHFTGVKGDNDELKKSVEKHTLEYAELAKNFGALTALVDEVKKELDTPLMRGGKDLEDSDRKTAIEIQRQQLIAKQGNDEGFRADTENLVDVSEYRNAVRKMMRAGVETKQAIMMSMTPSEKKAFEASTLDSTFFVPEMLGLEIDCNIECAELLDLYNQVTVSRTNFMFPRVLDYGAIGKYGCDAKCDAEFGPEGNIIYDNGKTNDWRGVFCFQKKVLQEANYDLFGFMVRAVQRSYRIARNATLMTGSGVDEPIGWLTQGVFPRLKTAGGTLTPQEFRRFMAAVPVEYGEVVAVMHQNIFSYLAASVDNNGRFIFGDGLMTFSPDDVRERIRISNCLPDATDNNTLGTDADPFAAGDFLVAAGNWSTAYTAVNKRPMWMEQYVGGSTAWCTMYQFGAEDGGFIGCPNAVRVLVAGP